MVLLLNGKLISKTNKAMVPHKKQMVMPIDISKSNGRF